MKLIQTMLLVLVLGSSAQAAWMTDFRRAQARAQAEGKAVLINFTGSDWCGWCIKLRNEVFSQPQFVSYARQNLVLVEIDFPKRGNQSAAVKAANRELATRFGVKGYPTIVFLNSAGNEIGRAGYRKGGVEPYVEAISKVVGKPPPDPRSALFGGAAVVAPPAYDDLKLKSITGRKTRLALVNNRTFAEGEAARVKLGDKQVLVRCLAIKKESVIVAVHGEDKPRELPLEIQ